MIDTLLESFTQQRTRCLEMDRLIDRLMEENRKTLNTLNELIAGVKRVKEKIN